MNNINERINRQAKKDGAMWTAGDLREAQGPGGTGYVPTVGSLKMAELLEEAGLRCYVPNRLREQEAQRVERNTAKAEASVLTAAVLDAVRAIADRGEVPTMYSVDNEMESRFSLSCDDDTPVAKETLAIAARLAARPSERRDIDTLYHLMAPVLREVLNQLTRWGVLRQGPDETVEITVSRGGGGGWSCDAEDIETTTRVASYIEVTA